MQNLVGILIVLNFCFWAVNGITAGESALLGELTPFISSATFMLINALVIGFLTDRFG